MAALDPTSKKAAKRLQMATTALSAGWFTGGIILGLTGVGAIPAAAAGLGGVITGLVAYGAGEIASDPPRKDFHRCEVCKLQMFNKIEASKVGSSWGPNTGFYDLDPFREFFKEGAVLVHGLSASRKAIERYSGVQEATALSNHESETIKFLQMEALKINCAICADTLTSMTSIAPRLNIAWHQIVCSCGLDTLDNIHEEASNSTKRRINQIFMNESIDEDCQILNLNHFRKESNITGIDIDSLSLSSGTKEGQRVSEIALDENWYEATEDAAEVFRSLSKLSHTKMKNKLENPDGPA